MRNVCLSIITASLLCIIPQLASARMAAAGCQIFTKGPGIDGTRVPLSNKCFLSWCGVPWQLAYEYCSPLANPFDPTCEIPHGCVNTGG